MADKPRLGIWHTTTLQTAKQHQHPNQHQHAYTTSSLAGQKRLYDASGSHVPGENDGAAAHKRLGAQPTFRRPGPNLTSQLPRLIASRIESLDGPGKDGPFEYTQRQAFPSTPTATLDPLLSLLHPAYGLPGRLRANFASQGIKSIYPWQKQCLLGPGLLNGEKNLVYSAPTGGGKSLVADVLMLKRVLEDRDAKAILVLPYVALVQEKVRWLRNVVNGISREALGQKEQFENEKQKFWAQRADKDTIRVVGFFGGSKIRATWSDFDIAVCTIEKVSSPGSLGESGLTVAGELPGKRRHRRLLHFQTPSRCLG